MSEKGSVCLQRFKLFQDVISANERKRQEGSGRAGDWRQGRGLTSQTEWFLSPVRVVVDVAGNLLLISRSKQDITMLLSGLLQVVPLLCRKGRRRYDERLLRGSRAVLCVAVQVFFQVRCYSIARCGNTGSRLACALLIEKFEIVSVIRATDDNVGRIAL